MVIYTVHWRKGRDPSRSAHSWNYSGSKPNYHIKTYTSKKAIYDDVEKAWSLGYFPEWVEAGSCSNIVGNWVNGPNFIGTVYKSLKMTLDYMVYHQQPYKKVEGISLF